jgi:hypothetical protein
LCVGHLYMKALKNASQAIDYREMLFLDTK